MTSFKRILGAAALCTLGMTVVALAVLLVFDGVSWDTVFRAGRATGFTALAGCGYGLTLWLARRNMRADVALGGRRDLIAGTLAIVALLGLSAITQGASAPAILSMSFASGIVSALAMYFPWFQRHPSKEPMASAATDGTT